MRRVHVQHVLLSLQPGGLENGVVNVINGLDSLRIQNSVCCLKQAGEFASRIKDRGVPVFEMGLQKGNDLLLPFRLAMLFRRSNVDIVHTRNAEAFFYGFLGAKIAGVSSIIHSEHGRTFDDRAIRFWAQRLFSKYTNIIFALSEQLRSDLVKFVGIPADKIGVQYNGVDVSRFSTMRGEDVRRELGIGAERVVVGSIGRLVSVKNYPLLLRAVKSVNLDITTILFVGDGPELDKLKKLATNDGLIKRVIFLGHREDVADLLGAMDIFVLPSVSEGMSNTMLEAMAAGIPVIASRVGGNPEIVRDGIDGLLFENGNEGELRERLIRLIGSPALRMQLGVAGRKRVIDKFSMEAMISRYESLYTSVTLKRQ